MNLLYPLLLAGVLLLTGCTAEDDTPVPSAAAETVSDNMDAHKSGSGTESQTRVSPIQNDAAPLRTESESFRVVFFGDSITAGFGVNEEEAFPYLIQTRVNDFGLPFLIVNSGFSGDTSTGGLSRIDWILRNPVDVLVLELGGNDGLRGIDLTLTRKNLEAIVERTLSVYPDCKIVVAGMMVPPNLGHEYTTTFRELFPALAERFDAVLIPFILEGVGGIRELNQPDGIHPTAEGHAIIAETVWRFLQPVLMDVQNEH